VRDDLPLYQREHIRPFGINPASAESHAGYAARLGLNFPLLSDPGMIVATAYGAVRPDGRSIARSVVVVGQEGRILYSQAGAPGAKIVLESLR
jgi:thioredoxin-dependent peroxiredoxin